MDNKRRTTNPQQTAGKMSTKRFSVHFLYLSFRLFEIATFLNFIFKETKFKSYGDNINENAANILLER